MMPLPTRFVHLRAARNKRWWNTRFKKNKKAGFDDGAAKWMADQGIAFSSPEGRRLRMQRKIKIRMLLDKGIVHTRQQAIRWLRDKRIALIRAINVGKVIPRSENDAYYEFMVEAG